MLREHLRFAIRVAQSMSRDPEVESLAGEACWRATESFDPALGVPIRRYIALCVKRAVWCYWRQVKLRLRDTQNDAAYAAEAPQFHDEPLRIPHEDWRLLYEHHVEKLPLYILARQRRLTVYAVKRALDAAEGRFFDAIRS